MPSIYDNNFNLQSENLSPPDKRKPRILALLRAFVKPLQWLRDLFYTEYADGFTGAKWSNLTVYTEGQRVRYIDRAVYECILTTTAGIVCTDESYWIKIQDLYIGVRERMKYNSNKMLFEYVLNKWFEVDPLPADQIYIQNNVLDLNGFLVGESEPFTSSVAETEAFQLAYLGNAYTYDLYAFTIYVPVAVWTALAATADDRDNIIRSEADKYVFAGISYNIVTY